MSVCILGRLSSVRPSFTFRLVNLKRSIFEIGVMSSEWCHPSSLYQAIKLRDRQGVNKRGAVMIFPKLFLSFALFTTELTKISRTLSSSSKTHQGPISSGTFFQSPFVFVLKCPRPRRKIFFTIHLLSSDQLPSYHLINYHLGIFSPGFRLSVELLNELLKIDEEWR